MESYNLLLALLNPASGELVRTGGSDHAHMLRDGCGYALTNAGTLPGQRDCLTEALLELGCSVTVVASGDRELDTLSDNRSRLRDAHEQMSWRACSIR
jgi:hypothetical protein